MTTIKDAILTSPEGLENIPEDIMSELAEKLGKEIRNSKLDNVGSKLMRNMGDLLNISIPEIFIRSWQRVKSIRDALNESKQNPGSAIIIELAEHTIESQHSPYIEIRINGIPLPKKIQFTLNATFNLKGFIIKILNGSITEIHAGNCEITFILTCENIVIVEKKSEPVRFPASIAF